jgi:hypothetical protein
MAWPPAALPTNRTNATPQQDTHPADHNAIGQAINDTVARIQANETAAAVWRGFNAYTVAEITIAQNPSFTNALSFGFTNAYKPGRYNLVFTGQVWTNQDYLVRVTVNSTAVSENRIQSFGNYTSFAVATAVSLATNDVIWLQMSALSGSGGLRSGANLIGNFAYG